MPRLRVLLALYAKFLNNEHILIFSFQFKFCQFCFVLPVEESQILMEKSLTAVKR